MGYIPDPRFARFTYAARPGAPGKGVRGGFIAAKHETGWVNPWEDSRLNPLALEEIQDMESNKVTGSKGVSYTSVNPGEAWGRYQFRVIAFKDVGMIDARGNWIEGNKYGVTSFEEFLANPITQEMAMEDFLVLNQGYLKANGSNEFIGEEIQIRRDGRIATLKITINGLIAAAHHAGAGGAHSFVQKLVGSDGVVEYDDLSEEEMKTLERLVRLENITIFNDE